MMQRLQYITAWPKRMRQAWHDENVYRYRGGSFSMSLDDALKKSKNAVDAAEKDSVAPRYIGLDAWVEDLLKTSDAQVAYLKANLEREPGDSDSFFKQTLYACLKKIAAANGITIGRIDG